MEPVVYEGKTALVTGASSGIGRVFARRLAERGVSQMILVARREAALRALGDELECDGRVKVEILTEDLAAPGAVGRVAERVAAAGLAVDVLVNNAGFATYGLVSAEADQAELLDEVQLNCAAVVGLTLAFLPGMQARRNGVVVNLASTAAFQPLPYMAVYGATKAFVLSFTEALWAENRDHGVRVLALCPGATETEFFDRVGADEASIGPRLTPEAVVDIALRALDHSRPSVISGVRNWVLANAGRFIPRRRLLLAADRTLRPRD